MKTLSTLVAATIMMGTASAQTTTEKMNAYLQAAEKTGRLHGYVQVKKDDQLLVSKGYGYANYENKTKGTADTRYQIGSVTKQFTGTLVLKLAGQGKLSLQDKLSQYFPGFPNAEKITIEQLLTHTSGIHNYTNEGRVFDSLKQVKTSADNMVPLLASFSQDFEPGTQWGYSNSGYSMLGYIIEKASGRSYAQCLQQYIFDPIGMKHSGVGFAQAAQPKATGYYFIQEKEAMPAVVLDASIPFAAGAIYTTPTDLLSWDESLLKGKVFTEAERRNAFTPRMNKYGLGWFIDTIHNTQVIHHGGAIDGFHVQNFLVPADNLIIMVMLNAEMYNSDQVARDLLAIARQQEVQMPVTMKEVKVDPEIFNLFAGSYDMNGQMKINVKKEGDELMVSPEGQPWARLFPTSDLHYFFKIMDATIEFVKDADGKVNKFIFREGKHVMEGKRIK